MKKDVIVKNKTLGQKTNKIRINSVDPDQAAPRGAAKSGSTLFTIQPSYINHLLIGQTYSVVARI